MFGEPCLLGAWPRILSVEKIYGGVESRLEKLERRIGKKALKTHPGCGRRPLPLRPFDPSLPPPGQQVIEEQRRRLAELKQRAVAEAQCQWEALHGSQTQLAAAPLPSSFSSLMACGGTAPPLVHHSILHHQPPSAGERPYDTLSLESSDSVDTSISTGNNSACSPDNVSRFQPLLLPRVRSCVRAWRSL